MSTSMLGPASERSTKLAIKLVHVLLVVLFPCWVSSKRVSTTTSTYPQPLHGIERDPFVENAPLVIAVACRDGVAIVAATEPSLSSSIAHQPKLKNHNNIADSEPLMYYNADEIKNILQKRESNTTTTIKEDDDGYPFMDLPDTFSGPFRIQSVTNDYHRRSSTFFVSCGWKVDGYIQLRNAIRDIVDNERYTFGIVDDDEISVTLIANQVSLYMAQCAVSERFRTLSCTALIGGINYDAHMNHKKDNSSNAFGCVWFIDATGSYPVRAHCMGGGSMSIRIGKNKELQTVPLADYINQELLYQFRHIRKNDSSASPTQPYFDMTTDEALIMILDMLSMKDQNSKSHSSATVTTSALLPHNTRLELVCISSISHPNTNQRRRRMIRKRISDIWGMKKKRNVS